MESTIITILKNHKLRYSIVSDGVTRNQVSIELIDCSFTSDIFRQFMSVTPSLTMEFINTSVQVTIQVNSFKNESEVSDKLELIKRNLSYHVNYSSYDAIKNSSVTLFAFVTESFTHQGFLSIVNEKGVRVSIANAKVIFRSGSVSNTSHPLPLAPVASANEYNLTWKRGAVSFLGCLAIISVLVFLGYNEYKKINGDFVPS